MKTCSRCKQQKALDEFPCCAKKKDGRHSYCRLCNTAVVADWKARNPDRAKSLEAGYRARNLDQVRERNRTFRALYPERMAAATAKYRAANSDKVQRSFTRSQLKKYGLSIEDFDELLAMQDGGCAICGREDYGTSQARRLAVDHCHSTGTIRGLLCWNCNTVLGKFEDDPDRLVAAALYLLVNQGGTE